MKVFSYVQGRRQRYARVGGRTPGTNSRPSPPPLLGIFAHEAMKHQIQQFVLVNDFWARM